MPNRESKPPAETDASGAFAQNRRHGRSNNGVLSAKPQVLTGTDDSTFENHPDGGPSDRDQDGVSPAKAGKAGV